MTVHNRLIKYIKETVNNKKTSLYYLIYDVGRLIVFGGCASFVAFWRSV